MFPVEFYLRVLHFCENFGIVQILKFVRFWGNSGHVCFYGYRIRIRHQNLVGTIFRVSGHNFCTKFWHNWGTVCRRISATSASGFPSNFIYGCCTWTKILETSKSSKMPLIVRAFFWSTYQICSILRKQRSWGVLGVAEHESVHKIWVVSFLDVLGPIFARNFGITLRRWVVRTWQRLYRVSRRILHLDAALLRQFWKCPILKNALTIIRSFFGSTYRICSILWKQR